MKKSKTVLFFFLFIASISSWGQNATLEGYVFESNNRGYLNLVRITIMDNDSKVVMEKIYSDLEGFFTTQLPLGRDYLIRAEKDVFKKMEILVSTKGLETGQKLFAKFKMERKPGYIFDVTIAEERIEDNPADAILGARVEVYNNTKEEEILVLENHSIPAFSVTFESGNHYSVMIRKNGFFTKRMEAYVDIEGCILCFDGVGEVKPGVSDNLTAGHQMGTLIANVEMKKLEVGKGFKIENIYYNYNKWDIREDAAEELDKLITVLKDNPQIIVELESHTDSRGKDVYNLELSQKRAKAAVDYIKTIGGIEDYRIKPRGYGESKLANGCKNGVECNESKHQENRRTELKIVGILSSNSFETKSLKEIIEEEAIEKMIANLQNEEEIKVAAGEEMPEALKAQNEASRNQSEVKSDPDPKTEEKPVKTSGSNAEIVIQTTSPKQNAEETPKTKPEKQIFTPETEPLVRSDNLDRSPISNNKMNMESVVSSTGEVGKENKEYNVPESNNSKPRHKYTKADRKENLNSSKFLEEHEIASSNRFQKPKILPGNYSGYKIEFFSSQFELPASHEIFSQHGNITIAQKKDGAYSYLLGDFTDLKLALGFLDNVIKFRYPLAMVVKYQNGNRVVQ